MSVTLGIICQMFLIILLRETSKNIFKTRQAMRLKNNKCKSWRKYYEENIVQLVPRQIMMLLFVLETNCGLRLDHYVMILNNLLLQMLSITRKVLGGKLSLDLIPLLLIMIFRTVMVTCCSLIQPRHQLLTSTFLVY